VPGRRPHVRYGPVLIIGDVDEAEEDDQETRRQLGRDWLAALRWLIDATAGLWPLIEADAVRILAADIDLHPTGPTACRVRSAVTVKLRDVTAFRQCAVDACPPEDTTARAEIATGFGVAWQWAAEPYAPLRRISRYHLEPDRRHRATPTRPLTVST
jgi:hypothetical protein